MKRMIKEEFVDYVTPDYNYINLQEPDGAYKIFVNPTPSELNSIFTWRTDKIVRGLVDIGNQEVYIFDYNVIHLEALDQILENYTHIFEYDISNIEIHGKKKFIKNTYQSLPIKNIPWIKKYFSSYKILSDNPFDESVKEEYIDSYNPDYSPNENYEIFKNPTPQEMRDIPLSKEHLRGLYDIKKKEIYVFSVDLVHAYACIKIWGTSNLPNGFTIRFQIDGYSKTIEFSIESGTNQVSVDKIKAVVEYDPFFKRYYPNYSFVYRRW